LDAKANSEKILHYGPDGPPGAITVPAVLFPDCVRVDDDGIHPNFDSLTRAEGRLAPPETQLGQQRSGALTYDALGLLFLLLSRLEERDHPNSDRYGRFPIAESLAFRHSDIANPLCDDAARAIASALTGNPAPPSRTTYRVWLTHDWDRLRGYHRPWEPLRYAAGDIVRRRAPGSAAARLRRSYFTGEPWRSLRSILDISERAGHTSHFFFMGRSDDPMDSPYMLRYPSLARNLSEEIVSRGHAVGFHPGFRTCRDAGEWTRQKRDVEEILGQEIIHGRQHMLMFDPERTLDIWDDGGMKMEMTLSYPELPGFRSGTCRGHAAYSLRRRRTLKLSVLPTAIMDFGFFGGRYRDMSADEAAQECQPIIDTCKRTGGDLVVLYHPTQWRDARVRSWYEQVVDSA
jgi:hypothetical protein